MVKNEELTAYLANIPLFQGLSNRQLKKIVSIFISRTYQAEQAIITQGKSGLGMFMVISGRAEAVLEHEDGSKIVVNKFGPEDFFGEVAMLDGGPRTASVIAREKTECLILGRAEFFFLMEKDADMAIKISVALAKRLRRTTDMI